MCLTGIGIAPAVDPVVELGVAQAVNLSEATQTEMSFAIFAHPLLSLPGRDGGPLLESFQLHPRSLPHRRLFAVDVLRLPLTKLFSASDLNSFLDNNSETEFFIHLLPSSTDYEVTTRILIPDHTSLADLKISITGEGDHPEETRLVNKTALGTGGYENPDYIIALNRSRPGASSEDAPITALQLVVENLL